MTPDTYFLDTEAVICNRRLLDASRIAAWLTANGWQPVTTPSEAALSVLVTCTVTNSKIDECLARARDLAARSARLLVVGCLPGLYADRFRDELNAVALPPTRLAELDALFPDFAVPFTSLPDANVAYQPTATTVAPARSPRTIRIAHGCRAHCTYCVIRLATGPLRSKPLAECLAELDRLTGAGYRHIILDAEDAGAYGLDGGPTFDRLLLAMHEQTRTVPGMQFEIQTMNPQWALLYADAIAALVAAGVMQRVKCDIQSGSARILRLMGRPYAIDRVQAFFARLQSLRDDLRFSSQFIAGFPSETDDEFAQTFALIRDLPLHSCKLFAYADMAGAPSSRLPGKLPPEVIMARIDRVRAHFAPLDTLCTFTSGVLNVVRLPL